MKIFLYLLSITGILLLLVVLNNFIICEKSETIDGGVYYIYRRNLSEFKSEKNKGLRSSSHRNKLGSTLDEKNNNISLSSQCININYNDLSKQLTLEDLHNVLDNLKERPSDEDLYNIWNHALGISKEGFQDMIKELAIYIEDYLLTYEYQRYHHFPGRKPICRNTKYRTWKKSMYDIGVALSFTDMEHTLTFFSLIKDGATTDDIKNFIYSFIDYYSTLKNNLFKEHKKIFTERLKNPKRLTI
ncbi:Plasmodium exported protein (PHISTa), unknown, putative [Plasmodium gaboni]|uniref:Plasmodium RESA N-terminal domain-containing protein n=1 Tax=Plasmodium gaboni TaxID=647221 RepID=A0ABY0KW79_9APIC|nr:Plasmodium exported protein (PHISTa), unknown, putative [Plasmodium gaboni]